jgi:hypothetical protein
LVNTVPDNGLITVSRTNCIYLIVIKIQVSPEFSSSVLSWIGGIRKPTRKLCGLIGWDATGVLRAIGGDFLHAGVASI